MNRLLCTPKKAWPLMVLGLLLWFSQPFVEKWNYDTSVQQKLCSAFEEPGIHFFALFFLDIILAPVLFFILWLILRKYPGSLSLLLWRKDRPSTSWLWTLVASIGIYVCAHDFTLDVYYKIPPYGLNQVLWIYLILCLRIILISKVKSKGKLSDRVPNLLIIQKKHFAMIATTFILWFIYPFFNIWTLWRSEHVWMETENKLYVLKQFIGHISFKIVCINFTILFAFVFLFRFLFKKYQGDLSLLVWDPDRPWRSLIWTIIFLTAFLQELRIGMLQMIEKIPPYGILAFAGAYLILYLRAFIIGKNIKNFE